MNTAFIRAVLDSVMFKNYAFTVLASQNGFGWQYTITPSFMAPCVKTGERLVQIGRPWVVPYPDSEDSIVKTAFLAVKQCEEHELMEFFSYKGQRPFDPHRSLV